MPFNWFNGLLLLNTECVRVHVETRTQAETHNKSAVVFLSVFLLWRLIATMCWKTVYEWDEWKGGSLP